MRVRIDSTWLTAAIGIAACGIALMYPSAGIILLFLAALVLLAGVRIENSHVVWSSSGKLRRLIGIGALVLIIGGGCGWYFWPSQLSEAAQNNYPPEFARDGCGGVLHRVGDELRFGGAAGEGESICVISKAEEARVLAVCSIEHLCRVTGKIAACNDSGECEIVSKIKSVVVPLMPVLPSDAPAWVKTAYKEREQTEIPGPQENPRIVEYFNAIGAKKTYRDDLDDWASAFAEWSLNKNGIIGPKSDDPFAWLHWGQKLDQPRFGCITILSFSGLHHVGFFFTDNGESILVLGGNQDDTVNISRYSKSSVVGYRWPAGQK